MAICMMLHNPDQTSEQAAAVMAHVRESGPVPPDGARLVITGPGDPGWRVVAVWDSQEDLERFLAQRLAPAYAQEGLRLDGVSRATFEVTRLIAGDMVGAAA